MYYRQEKLREKGPVVAREGLILEDRQGDLWKHLEFISPHPTYVKKHLISLKSRFQNMEEIVFNDKFVTYRIGKMPRDMVKGGLWSIFSDDTSKFRKDRVVRYVSFKGDKK